MSGAYGPPSAPLAGGVPLIPGQIVYPDALGRATGDNHFTRDPVTGALTLFDYSGDQAFYDSFTPIALGRKIELRDGSGAFPVLTVGPTVKITRVENLDHVALGTNPVDNEANAALSVISQNKATSSQQVVGVYAAAISYATGSAGHDAVGLVAQGRVANSGIGTGTGAYIEGRRSTATGQARGIEVRAENETSTDSGYATNAVADVVGIWATASSSLGKKAGVAFQVGNAGSVWQYGFAAISGSVSTAFLADETNATTSLLVRGTHTYGLDTNSATFGATSAVRIGSGQRISSRNAADSADITLMHLGGTDTLDIYNSSLLINNGNTATFVGGVVANSFSHGTDNASDFGAASSGRARDIYVGRDLYAASIKPSSGTTVGITVAPTLTPGAVAAANGTVIGGGVVATGTSNVTTYNNVHILPATQTGTGVVATSIGLAVDAPTIGTANLAGYFAGRVGIGSSGGTNALDVVAPASTGGLNVQGSGGNVAIFRNSGGNSLVFIDNGDLRLNSGASLKYQTDGGGDIGASGGTRPNNVYIKNSLVLAGANGSQWMEGTATETLTLATGAAFTDTSANLLPTGAEIKAVLTRVTTAITTAATFSVGDPTTAARFKAAQAGIALNSTTTGLDHLNTSLVKQDAAAKVRITCNVNPGAGVVEIIVLYRQYTAPTS